MRRLSLPVYPDWRAWCAEQSFDFAEPGGEGYWRDDAAYAFDLTALERDVEGPADELLAMMDDLAGRVAESERDLAFLGIPSDWWDAIRASRKRGDLSVYGRMDLAYDGTGPAKLLEFNADTPTGLYETGAVQWHWLERRKASGDLPADADQYNRLHEALIERWRAFPPHGGPLVASSGPEPEDRVTAEYMRDLAQQAGHVTGHTPIDAIGLTSTGLLVDERDQAIRLWFKLYPWEWLATEVFGPALRAMVADGRVIVVEPLWRSVLSNKGMLALLWRDHPGHPSLLPTYAEDDPAAVKLGPHHAEKPFFAREGHNVRLIGPEGVTARAGPYGGRAVRQALAAVPSFDTPEGRVHTVLGAWAVGNAFVALSVREDASRITTDDAWFVPHVLA